MRKTTTVALTTVAALLATGGATALATSGSDTATLTTQTAAQDASTADDGGKAQDESAKEGPKSDGSKRFCKRAPKIDKRIDRVLGRLGGDETKKGSIDRLEKRIELAKELGHDEFADFLNERLKDRRGLKPKLEDRKEDLGKLKGFCEELKKETEDEGQSDSDEG